MTDTTGISLQELQLATRNHGMPLEALRYPVTPVGLHYLLTHYDIPLVDGPGWQLTIDGRVERPLHVSLDDLRSMPAITRTVTMECAGNGRAFLDPRPASQPWLLEAVGTGEWTGVSLDHVLSLAGARDDAVEVLFTGADRGVDGGIEQAYERSITLDTAREGALLAYELNGAPLPPQHGFPLRLVVPGWYGMTNVKWLTSITLLDRPFDGYQMTHSYRMRMEEDETGEPLQRMAPRSLMVPPGIPDFFTRSRIVPQGECLLEGRAWSGSGPITGVEVSIDGGAHWAETALEPPADPSAWVRWTYRWDAKPGESELCCRATDSSGAAQPLRPQWNVGGYTNNAVHRVPVTVVAAGGATVGVGAQGATGSAGRAEPT
jgi:DMSO/TMAO reductase YedYZ molybdopterin-dependent catalytic subunit